MKLTVAIPTYGRDGVLTASIADLLRVFKKDGMIEKDPPRDKLVDGGFSSEIEKALGPFELINKASKLEGCR
jgi:hypothetical protein